MGGIDTRGRYHVHWGAPETYGERREESALRRSGRPVPDPAYQPFEPIDLAAVDEILEATTTTRSEMLEILEATQAAYGYLPVAALKRISQQTGAWYAMIYGTASYYGHLRFEPRRRRPSRPPRSTAHRPSEATLRRRARRGAARVVAPPAAAVGPGA